MGLENLRQIKIGDKWSYSDFGLLLSSGWTLSESAPKTTYVDVPEADGQLDMSEALSGEIHYQSRNFSASLIFQDDTQSNWELKRRQLANYVHGKRLKLQLPDTPDYYLQGRFSVGPLKTDYPFATVDVTAVLDPWLYKNDLTVYSIPAPLPPVQNSDGSYNHVAYAYSADGTDRFTTIYPKPNLLNGTKVHDIFKGTGTANGGGTQRYTLDKGLKISDLKLSSYQDLIFEFDWKATGTNPSGTFVYQAQTYFKGKSVTVSPTNTSGHVKNKFYNLPVTTDTSTFITIRQDNIPTTVTVEISNVMMYIVDYSPWMPSSSEVTTSDYPAYIGQYTDLNLIASTDPTKYLWQPYFLLVGGNIALVLSNDRKTAVPSITTNQPLSITRGSLTENIGVGTFQLPDFALTQGDNSLTIMNKGTAVAEFSISYQEGSQ